MLAADEPDAAIELARTVDTASNQGMDARMLEGVLLRQQGRWAEVIELFRRYLDAYPGGIRRTEARYRIAEATEKLGDRAGAVALYRLITIERSSSRWARPARRRMKALLRRLPRKQRREAARWTAADYLASGMVKYRAMRNPASARLFARALEAPGLTPELACEIRYYLADSWYKERKRQRSAELFDLAVEVCAVADPAAFRIRSAYKAGRSYAIAGDWRAAADRFRVAEELAADAGSTLVDDARVRQAEAWEMLGDDDRVTELLGDNFDLYPEGDMRAEALWRLAWRDYRRHDYLAAAGWLRRQIEAKPIEHNYWAEGQAQYWLARSLAHIGDRAGAIAAYRETVRRYPLTYYALQALNRLREEEPDIYAEQVHEIAEVPDGFTGPPMVRVSERAAERDPDLARLIDFLRLGLDDAAGFEMARLARTPRDRGVDPDHEPVMWVVAKHYHDLGRYEQSHWITRWHALDFKRHWPVGHVRAKWEIAYPPGYRDLIEQVTAERGVPAALQIAIVREESGFSPRLESWANAIGLSQLIKPTARRFAGGLRVTSRTLRDPETNLTIGANFLAFLVDKWDGVPALIAPSYNAGEGAVARWLRERPDLPLDEWIESIPADQARNYAKRVLSSYFAYSYLADGSIPGMPNQRP
jgi:soluble lytic murein transglycosylase